MPLDAKVYVSDRKDLSFVRQQSGDRVRCDEPRIESMVCMFEDDFIDLATRRNCE